MVGGNDERKEKDVWELLCRRARVIIAQTEKEIL